MGTWGAGNFDSDNAREYLDSIESQLIQTIEDCFNGKFEPERYSPDDEDILSWCGEFKLLPSVDLLVLIYTNYESAPSIEEKIAQDWKSRYLAIYDLYIDMSDPKEYYKVERRKVIEATFDKLIDLAREWDAL